ncbi:MAG: DNA-directed RNA polymerase subunit omega [Acidobacteria bacterium]|nr:DNA-directed RNA polymerase subunit omega [Acidobacteriota bacterium]
MTQRTIVRVPDEIANKYRFVVVAGKRCEQLQRGAFPKVEVVVPVNKHGQAQDAPKLASFWGQVAMAEVEENRIEGYLTAIKTAFPLPQAPSGLIIQHLLN